MNTLLSFENFGAHYQLRFTDLFNRGRGFAFPCDAKGDVDLSHLSDHGRYSYVHARATVGTELSLPVVAPWPDPLRRPSTAWVC